MNGWPIPLSIQMNVSLNKLPCFSHYSQKIKSCVDWCLVIGRLLSGTMLRSNVQDKDCKMTIVLPDGRTDHMTLGSPQVLIRNGACCKHNEGFHQYLYWLHVLDCSRTGMCVNLDQCDSCSLNEPIQVKTMDDINLYECGL